MKKKRMTPHEKSQIEKTSEDVQYIHSAASAQHKTSLLTKIVIILLAIIFVFYLALLTAYWYDDYGQFNVYTPNHECVYSEEGVQTAGDCQHYGYTEYFCVYSYCDSVRVEYDTELGDHQYESYEVVVLDGYVYHVYTCMLCGEENWVNKGTEEDYYGTTS